MARSGAITYDGLPLSNGGTHKLRTKGPAAGFKAVNSFVNAVSLETSPRLLIVELLEGGGVPRSLFHELSTSFNSRFVPKRHRMLGNHVGHQWAFDPPDLDHVIETLEHFRPIPEVEYAGHVVVVYAEWNLVLFDADSGQALPHQDPEGYLGFDVGCEHYLGRSFLYSRISEKTTAHLFLSLPFEEVTDNARRVAADLQRSFPVRMSSKHWKMWWLTKSGNRYLGRKIPSLV